MPVYNPNTPLATNPINQTQAPIQTNFASIMSLIDINHVDFSDPIDYGKHNVVDLVTQGADPGTTANEMALYTKMVAGSPELFLQEANNGAVISLSTSVTASAAGVTTYTFSLINGYVVKIGFTSGSLLAGDVSTSVPFPVAFPTACLTVVCSQFLANSTTSPNNILHITGFTKNNFVVFNRQGTGGFATDVTFIAVGN